jgi:hypothetical protein
VSASAARAGLAAVIAVLLLALPSSAAATDTLLTGQTLSAGQSLVSADGHYALIMQGDGNLVLYLGNGPGGLVPLWSSGTSGDTGAHALLQSNGNVVLYDAANEPLWSSNTSSAGCTNLTVQDDGNLVLYNAAGPIWNTATERNVLAPGDWLMPGESIFSRFEQYQLAMQSDGNLVLYGPTGALWSSNTWGIPGSRAVMQTDGNLVVYSSAGRALWNSGTFGHSGAEAFVQDDGNFVVYGGGAALWNSATEGNRAAGTPKYSRPAFQACPPPPAPAPANPSAPVAPVVSVPTKSPVPVLPRIKVRMTLTWTWNRGVTRLHRITIAHVPKHASVYVTCRGRGCPRKGAHVTRRHLGRLARFLDGRAFRSGDRVYIAVAQPGHRAEWVAIRIRYGRVPRVRLL